MQIAAAVARERAGHFSIEQLELTDPRADELLVRIVASGMCQTDLHGRDGYYNTPLPAVFGHEGAGVVAAIGNERDELRGRRSRRDFIPVVRRMRQLQAPDGISLPEQFRTEDARHARRTALRS